MKTTLFSMPMTNTVTQIEAMHPLSSQKGLGTTKWLLSSQYADQAAGLGDVHGVKLADLFLALQKEAA